MPTSEQPRNLLADAIADGIVRSIISKPKRQLSEHGWRLACVFALRQHWPDVDIQTAADWLTEYSGAKFGTPGYDWSYSAAETLAAAYVSEHGEATRP